MKFQQKDQLFRFLISDLSTLHKKGSLVSSTYEPVIQVLAFSSSFMIESTVFFAIDKKKQSLLVMDLKHVGPMVSISLADHFANAVHSLSQSIYIFLYHYHFHSSNDCLMHMKKNCPQKIFRFENSQFFFYAKDRYQNPYLD